MLVAWPEGTITLDAFQGVVFVGGFSYADVLDSAKGWAATIKFNPKVGVYVVCSSLWVEFFLRLFFWSSILSSSPSSYLLMYMERPPKSKARLIVGSKLWGRSYCDSTDRVRSTIHQQIGCVVVEQCFGPGGEESHTTAWRYTFIFVSEWYLYFRTDGVYR